MSVQFLWKTCVLRYLPLIRENACEPTRRLLCGKAFCCCFFMLFFILFILTNFNNHFRENGDRYWLCDSVTLTGGLHSRVNNAACALQPSSGLLPVQQTKEYNVEPSNTQHTVQYMYANITHSIIHYQSTKIIDDLDKLLNKMLNFSTLMTCHIQNDIFR